jgi:hypothetical protein
VAELGLAVACPTSEENLGVGRPTSPARKDAQRTFQLVLASIWLLDAVLQLQPFMFTRGSNGFSGMLNGVAAGNPSVVFHTITWNASIVYHHPIFTNTVFALIQFVIGFGITFTRTLRPALALSIVWSIGVWWFGEGAGGVFLGTATPFAGGPGGVLFYALLAILLWPRQGSDRSDRPSVAARSVGASAAKAIWAATWVLLGVLCVVGSGRQPQALRDLVAGLDSGEPGWMSNIDRASESFLLAHGGVAAVLLAVVCVLAAVSVYVSPRFTKFMIVLLVAAFGVIWIAVQDLGGILAGGATDPNSGPLVILLALIYWPLDKETAFAVVGTRVARHIALEA